MFDSLPQELHLFGFARESHEEVALVEGSLHQDCCDMGQNDTIGKIELNPSFVFSSDNTNCKNDIQ